MYVGTVNKKICRTSPESPNQSVCLIGLSGSGKTSRLNLMEYMHITEGGTVIVLDVNMSHSNDRIFRNIREEYLHAANRISLLRDGLGDGLLQPLSSENEQEQFVLSVNAAVQALSSAQNMGTRQISVLRRAVIEAMRLRKKFKTDAEALEFALEEQDDETGDIVHEKLWTLLNCGALKPAEKKIQEGKINILDFSGADSITQSSLAEIFLTNLWRRVRSSDAFSAKKNLAIVLDEFQNLSLRKDAVLPDLLREGRKFGINLLLATQSLEIFSKGKLAMLNQTATKLYFRQTQHEARRISKELYIEKTDAWARTLVSLRVGEAIAVGDFCVEGLKVCHPILTK